MLKFLLFYGTRPVFCGIAAVTVLLYGSQFLSYCIMILSGNNLHMSCDNIYMMQTRLQHSVSLTLTYKGKSLVCMFCFVCMFPSQYYCKILHNFFALRKSFSHTINTSYCITS